MNKNVLVTGAMGDIGTAIVEKLSNDDFQIFAAIRPNKTEEFRSWQAELNINSPIVPVEFDMMDKGGTIKAISVLLKSYKIGYLVNNAGITRDSTFKKMTIDMWEDVLGCNLLSLYYVTHPIFLQMLEEGIGRIVNISSVNALKGQFGQANYAAAKAGVIGFTKSLALESARKNITVNAIAPGYVNTSMVNSMGEELVKSVVREIPKNRLAEPQEIAGLVKYLFADDSGFITGETVSINGGQYLS
jgi:acetoacetyl-CoA reductase